MCDSSWLGVVWLCGGGCHCLAVALLVGHKSVGDILRAPPPPPVHTSQMKQRSDGDPVVRQGRAHAGQRDDAVHERRTFCSDASPWP